MKIVFDSTCLEYSKGHVEGPYRSESAFEQLKESGLHFIKPKPAAEKDVLLVHTKDHFERVKFGKYWEEETPVIDIKYPLLSAGAAINAAEIGGFSICRPPGHHAGRHFLGGFCYFNSIAIAVAKTGKKTAILDIDIHHGNGTQDIFLGSKDVLYLSIHESPQYPGTGLVSEKNCFNFPLPSGTKEDTYLKYLQKCIQEISKFKPEMLAVSIGFDTYCQDSIGNFLLKEESYKKIGEAISKLNTPKFFALEGGYSEEVGKLALALITGVEG
ncbi:MAG: histone deacetylase [Candidatus Aenigmarchaeota archaeon]|nr:histone deacetylase [Candidatus Aenigmarchaeota archaeon]